MVSKSRDLRTLLEPDNGYIGEFDLVGGLINRHFECCRERNELGEKKEGVFKPVRPV